MKKEEFIARYGEEAYEERKRQSRECHRKKAATESKAGLIARYGEEYYENKKKQARENYRKNGVTKKPDLIAKFGQDWYDNMLKKRRDYSKRKGFNRNCNLTEEQRRIRNEKSVGYAKKYLSDPVSRLHGIFRSKKTNSAPSVTPDEAMSLLAKEAEECGCPELLNMECMVERFHSNCAHGLDYGNLEILRYFYRLMQIKVARNESFTESDKEMMRYFRNWKVNTHNYGRLYLNNNWIIDVANVDMAYVEDMMRHAKGTDLLLTEEKYAELKGLRTE